MILRCAAWVTLAQELGGRNRDDMMADVYAQKFKVELVVGGKRRECPLEWLDQFCMRNFTNAAEFDDTLPLDNGTVEVSFRVTPERFAESFGGWLMQRGKGEGQPLQVEVSKLS